MREITLDESLTKTTLDRERELFNFLNMILNNVRDEVRSKEDIYKIFLFIKDHESKTNKKLSEVTIRLSSDVDYNPSIEIKPVSILEFSKEELVAKLATFFESKSISGGNDNIEFALEFNNFKKRVDFSAKANNIRTL